MVEVFREQETLYIGVQDGEGIVKDPINSDKRVAATARLAKNF